MTKIVINTVHGGFGLSPKAQRRYLELMGKKCYFYQHIAQDGKYIRIDDDNEAKKSMFTLTVTKDFGDEVFGKKLDNLADNAYWSDWNIGRDDPFLIQVINELGEEANDKYSELKIVEIPDGIEWEIDEYDGMETIHEKHRSWG